MWQITRGTTPTVFINVKEEIDLADVEAVWVFVSQANKVKIDKVTEDITILPEAHQLQAHFTQEETLGLKAKVETWFQVRILLSGEAMATFAKKVPVNEVYKGGVIRDER